MHALLGNGEERNKEVAQWEGGGGEGRPGGNR